MHIPMKTDGSAAVVMRVTRFALPHTGDRCAATCETNPAIARWRVDDGRCKLHHHVTYSPLAAGIVAHEGSMK